MPVWLTVILAIVGLDVVLAGAWMLACRRAERRGRDEPPDVTLRRRGIGSP